MYKVIGLVILAVFYGCYFTKMLLQKRKGITTDQIGKNKSGLEKRIEITMKLATLAVPVVECVSLFLDRSCLPDAVRIVGIVIGILGDAVFIISVITMRDSWRAGVSEKEKTDLVTNGIYRISRNPAFLGFDLVYLGILCMFFGWLLLAASVFAAIMFHLQIVKVEEPFLEKVFGADYREYMKHTNRYLGRR